MSVDWYPGAIRDEGPADKQGYTGTGQRTEKSGVIGHSMVGSYTSAKRELMNPARRASWHMSQAAAQSWSWRCGAHPLASPACPDRRERFQGQPSTPPFPAVVPRTRHPPDCPGAAALLTKIRGWRSSPSHRGPPTRQKHDCNDLLDGDPKQAQQE